MTIESKHTVEVALKQSKIILYFSLSIVNSESVFRSCLGQCNFFLDLRSYQIPLREGIFRRHNLFHQTVFFITGIIIVAFTCSNRKGYATIKKSDIQDFCGYICDDSVSISVFRWKIRPSGKLQRLFLVNMEFTYDGEENTLSYMNSVVNRNGQSME